MDKICTGEVRIYLKGKILEVWKFNSVEQREQRIEQSKNRAGAKYGVKYEVRVMYKEIDKIESELYG